MEMCSGSCFFSFNKKGCGVICSFSPNMFYGHCHFRRKNSGMCVFSLLKKKVTVIVRL